MLPSFISLSPHTSLPSPRVGVQCVLSRVLCHGSLISLVCCFLFFSFSPKKEVSGNAIGDVKFAIQIEHTFIPMCANRRLRTVHWLFLSVQEELLAQLVSTDITVCGHTGITGSKCPFWHVSTSCLSFNYTLPSFSLRSHSSVWRLLFGGGYKNLLGAGCFLNTIIKWGSVKPLILERIFGCGIIFFFFNPKNIKSKEDSIQLFLGDGLHKCCDHLGIQLAKHSLYSLSSRRDP